jgi:hypothetical protein
MLEVSLFVLVRCLVPVLKKGTGRHFQFSEKELVISSSSQKKNWSPVPVPKERTE